MNASITESIGEFIITGISVRTSNKDGRSQKDISELWSRFMTEGIMEKITNKESSDIYCLYTDYEGDFNGAYTTIIGCRVNSVSELTEKMVSKIIPASHYGVYYSSGEMPKALLDTWMIIWNSDIARTYIADFDIYGQESSIKTYVSVK